MADLAPGTALDVGSGEGADVIWLAGEDVADRITWQQGDLLSWDPAPLQFDLVSAQFMHLPRPMLESLHRRLAAAVRPGGTLLIVGHHPSGPHRALQRPGLPDTFFTADQVVAELAPREWQIVAAEAPERQPSDPDGRPVTIRDTVLRATRRRRR